MYCFQSVHIHRILLTVHHQGPEPFDMHSAADALQNLSNGIFDEPLVDVSWSEAYQINGNTPKLLLATCWFKHLRSPRALPHLGPTVGLGASAVQPVQAQDLEAVVNLQCDALHFLIRLCPQSPFAN